MKVIVMMMIMMSMTVVQTLIRVNTEEVSNSGVDMIYYSTVSLVPPVSTMDVWRGIT